MFKKKMYANVRQCIRDKVVASADSFDIVVRDCCEKHMMTRADALACINDMTASNPLDDAQEPQQMEPAVHYVHVPPPARKARHVGMPVSIPVAHAGGSHGSGANHGGGGGGAYFFYIRYTKTKNIPTTQP